MKKLTFAILLVCISLIANSQINLYNYYEKPFNSEEISSVNISNNARLLSVGFFDGDINLFDISAKRQLNLFKSHKRGITDLLFDIEDQYLISASEDEQLIVWDLYSDNVYKKVDIGFKINSIAISPDNRLLLVCGKSKLCQVYDFPNMVLRGELEDGHRKKDILFCCFDKHGTQALTVGRDNKLIYWNTKNFNIIRETTVKPNTINGSGIEITAVDVSIDRKIIALGIEETMLAKGGNRMIFKFNFALYDWQNGQLLEIIENNSCKINTFKFTPDKDYIIANNSTLRKTQISMINTRSGIYENDYSFNEVLDIRSLCLSSDGKWLSIGMDDKDLTSELKVLQLSGVDGFDDFGYNDQLENAQRNVVGSAIKLTTPDEPIISFGEPKKLAVLYLDPVGLPESTSKSATYLLESKLGNSSKLILIERNQIEKVITEMKYQLSGMTASDAVKVGQQLNADYVLIGSLNKLGSLLIITTKIVNVETAKIDGSREVECSNATIEDISSMIKVLAPTIAVF